MHSDDDRRGSGYMLYHSVGQYPGKAADMARGLTEFSVAWANIEGGHWPYALGIHARYLKRWQNLIGAADGSVTATESVTAAVSALVNALPAGRLRGRTVLVAEDCFPSNHFLLAGLQQSLGFTLRTVALRQGATWVEDEDMLAQWTPDVGLALITWVSSVSSHRSDVTALAAHGRQMGSLIGVDITQGAGLLPFDVNAPAIDFAVSTSLKWICGSPGAGMLYVAPQLIPDCAPTLRGWFSQPDPFNWDITRFSYAADIRRFDSGTPAIMAAAATLPALDWHAAQDHEAMRRHNRALTEELAQVARELGLRLATPADPAKRGGSIMLQLQDAETVQRALAALAEANVQADGRSRILRLSPGTMSRNEGVSRALGVLRQVTKA